MATDDEVGAEIDARRIEALRKEAELEQRTTQLLADRARVQDDHHFLQQFVRAAHQNAFDQHRGAKATSQELSRQIVHSLQVHEELRRVRWEFAHAQAACRSHAVMRSSIESARMDFQRKADAEMARLRGIFDIEARAHRQAALQAGALHQALPAAQAELAEQARRSQWQRKQKDAAQAALEQVRTSGATRETTVQRVLDDTLRRLEASFAQERADHEAREAIIMNKLHNVSRCVHRDPRTLPAPTGSSVVDASPKVPASVAIAPTASFRDDRNPFGVLSEVRQDLGLSARASIFDPQPQQISKEGFPPVISMSPTSSNQKEPSALERQVAELRNQQEALDNLWSDSSWKHGSLAMNHVAALASRSRASSRSAPETAAPASRSRASSQSAAETACEHVGGTETFRASNSSRVRIANGLIDK